MAWHNRAGPAPALAVLGAAARRGNALHLRQPGGAACAGKAVAALSDSDDEESEGSPPDTRRAGSMGEPVMGGPLSGGLTIPTSSDDPGAPASSARGAARSRGHLLGGLTPLRTLRARLKPGTSAATAITTELLLFRRTVQRRHPSPRYARAGDLKTGYLEKRIGEHSGRQSLPEAWRWQKRYFVLTEPKGALYYFKTADDPPNYKGIVNMRECKAEDVEARGPVVLPAPTVIGLALSGVPSWAAAAGRGANGRARARRWTACRARPRGQSTTWTAARARCRCSSASRTRRAPAARPPYPNYTFTMK